MGGLFSSIHEHSRAPDIWYDAMTYSVAEGSIMPDVLQRVSRPDFANTWIWFALLIPAVLLAFTSSYLVDGLTFSGKSVTPLIHIHTALMMMWVLMLIAQAWFIRTRRFAMHRIVGRSSFLVAPLIVVMGLIGAHETLNRAPDGISLVDAQIEVYTWGQLLGFGLAWALAIQYRRRTALHVRFIISTVFAFGSAIVFRIIMNWFAWVPGMDSLDGLAAANGAVLLLGLLALIAIDWRHGLKCSPYWVMTIVIAVMHLGYFTFAKTDGWMAFVQWFAGL